MFEGPLPIAATFSKDARFFAQGFEPIELLGGKGAQVVDLHGKRYLDWISGLGATVLGYNHSHFVLNVRYRIGHGIGFALPFFLERQVADKIVNLLGTHVSGWTPEGLSVRFGLSGTDATTMAVRLARAVTGRSGIISIGYHGWADWSVSTTPPMWGVLAQCVTNISFDNLAGIEISMLSGHSPAAVIIEQPPQEPAPDYWSTVRRLCTEHGALLIVDEVVTWPRYALGGACELYGIEPDIVCLGKGLGNGIPISAIVGRREYYNWFARKDPCFVSSTHFGNAVSLAAADAVLNIFTDECVGHLWMIGGGLKFGLEALGYKVIGQPPRLLIDFPSLSHKTYFVLGMRDRGILWNRPTLPNMAHTAADVAQTVRAAEEIKAEMDALGAERIVELMKDKLPMVLFEGR